MDFKYHLENAWKMTLQYIAPLIFMTLAMIAISVVTLGILAPVTMAGYMHSILLLVRERREPKVKDIFSQMRLFLPLLCFSIVVFIITMIGLMLLFLPGVLFLLAVSFACIYMLPLMTDRNLGLIEAGFHQITPIPCSFLFILSGFIIINGFRTGTGKNFFKNKISSNDFSFL
ncbi:MAG: hypothetical protein R6U40_02390 [Desulfobacterales bacterium]